MEHLSYGPSKPRLPHSLHIFDMRHSIRSLNSVFRDTADEHCIPESREKDVVNWCILELIDYILRGYGHRLIGHYHDDDGKTLLAQLSPTFRGSLDCHTNSLLRDIVANSRSFTAMFTGYDVILSKELLHSGT